jgi:hypothetical protein
MHNSLIVLAYIGMSLMNCKRGIFTQELCNSPNKSNFGRVGGLTKFILFGYGMILEGGN